jgi:hypothetical protein
MQGSESARQGRKVALPLGWLPFRRVSASIVACAAGMHVGRAKTKIPSSGYWEA